MIQEDIDGIKMRIALFEHTIEKYRDYIQQDKVTLNEIENSLISINDIVPYAIFNIIPECKDIVVLIPTYDGDFHMAGYCRDFRKFWSDNNVVDGSNVFTSEQMLKKLRGLNAKKSTKKSVMVEG